MVVLEEGKPEMENGGQGTLKKSFSFLEKIPFPALFYDRQLQFQQANERFLHFAGYQNQDELRLQPEEILFPGQSSAFSQMRSVLEKSDQENKEATALLCLRTKQGAQKWVQFSMSFIAEGIETGGSPLYLALLQDVSGLKEQESQLLKQ